MDSVNHTLSAEAAVFVPRQIPDPASVPLNQIPSYMTNCYPFVQGEYDRTRTTWNRHPRPPRQSFQDSSKYPRNFSGFHGNRMPAPQNFCGYTSVTPLPDNQWSPTPPVPPTDKQWSPMPSVTSMIHNLLQQPAEEIPSNLIRGEALISQNMNKTNRKKRNKDMMAWDLNGNHGKKKSGDIENCNVANTSYQEFINKDKHGFLGNRFSQGFNDNNNHGRLVSENEPVIKCYNGSSKPEINFGRKDLSSETMKNLKKNPDDRVKRGQRKKSGKSAGTGSENISKNGIATVAKKETSCQTDFPHSLSDLSLTQYPCDLYKGAVALYAPGSRNECESSDADMDSDSGYNSPLHKKTQVSYGSDTAAQQNCDLFAPDNNLGQQVGTSHSHSKIPTINDPLAVFDKVVDSSHQVSPPKMSYASIAQKKPSLSVYEVGNQSATGKKNNKPSTQPLEVKNGESRIVKTNERMEPRRAKRTGSGANRDDNGSSKENERQGNENSPNENKDAANENIEGKKKRRRNRKRRRKKKSEPDDEAESDIEGETTHLKQVELHFEDEDEFPDLSSNALSGRVDVTPLQDKVPLSYSAMLKQKATPVPVCHSQSSDSQHRTEFEAVQEVAASKDPSSETRGIRRRRKRHEMVEKAAEEELAEINFEQQMLRELNLQQKQKTDTKDSVVQQPGILKVNPKPATAGKKSKQGISLDLSAMIIALEKKVPETAKKVPETAKKVPVATAVKKKADVKNKESQKPASKHNLLDASAPIKRGKERENPKPKKPSSLKKVILKEREEKKKMRLLDDAETANNGVSLGIGMVSGIESDLSQDALSSKSSVDYGCLGTPASNDLSPISQTSPISMSPLSSGVSPHSSEVNSPIAGTIEKEVRMKIHSRRFREYCNQVLNKDIDNCCTTLLQDLVRFQDRMYHKDPLKAKSKRRLVLGLREVTKHLKLKKIKSVIISPNLEKIQSKGGLDDALNNILNLCNEQNVPFVFALGRRALGRACAKLVPVSVVGIFNYDGSDDNFRQLMDLTEEARQSYKEMVSVIEKEIQDYPRLGAAAAVPHIYAHMGHSRTPSGASVLSFTSSILSEPISENYPHSEPETDSKGYEIVKENNKNGNATSHLKAGLKNSSISEVLKSQMKIIYPHGNVDIDDGNEADTEECNERSRSVGGRCHGIDENEESEGSDNLSQPESDTIKALPHIDSIHSSTYDLNAEILSQHSGKNVDNCDTISTHSSRTLGDGSSTILADPGDRSKHDTPKSTGSPSSTLQRGKVIDAERIQNWVNQTKSRLEDLQYLQENTEDSSGTDSNTEDEEVVDELSQSNNNGGETKNRKEGITTQNMEKGNHGNQQIDTNKTVATESGNSTSVKVCENVGNSSQPPSVESSTSVLPENKNYNLTKDSHCKDDSTAGENKVISDKKTETEVARDVDSSNNQENESATNSVKTKSCDQVLPAINSDTAVAEGCNSKQKSDTTGTEGCNSNKNCVKETPTDS